MRIAIGADHGGFELKEAIVKFLKKKGHAVKDFGAFSNQSCDYPIIGYKVAKVVAKKGFPRGIVICKTGIGMSMAANKVKGIRAALCSSVDIARSSRLHNDANVLVFAANIVNASKAKKIAAVWLSTPSLGGRHRRRVNQIKKIDKLKR
ncbi:MAG: ribose 5-phosphate isomerase B [Candidatus Omnitrophica bacterium]|nr:ribose 5-phosphate isomerase B [Candidatus Omnitrophota bacterium]MBU4149482.1 ribose 5-phosphate isomerase B [Candidatus Omnitrophota bacterium]